METIFYDMPVDWDWIKQRPQFLAESLGAYYEMHAFYRKQFHRKGLQKNEAATAVYLHPFFTLPGFQNRSAKVAALNQRIRGHWAELLIDRLKPEMLWLTYPTQLLEIPLDFSGIIIYDCMDDYMSLNRSSVLRDRLPKWEKQLCERADLVFASSAYLAEHLQRDYRVASQKVFLLRNGCQATDLSIGSPEHGARNFRIGYIGTISSWFDFTVLQESLCRFAEIEYELIGPVVGTDVLRHDRVSYRGTVAHESLGEYVRRLDCLVLPFRDQPLVHAVDPVKLYEYIGFQRNILCTDYPEVRRFGDFVQFYRGAKEYCQLLERLLQDNHLRWDIQKAKRFLAENTWDKRAEAAVEAISKLGRKTI